MTDFFADLDDAELHTVSATNPHKAIAREADKPKFPCQSCAGSGRWRGGVNNNGETKCFACGGRGFFATSAADRRVAKVKREQTKRNRIESTIAAFDETNPGLRDRMGVHAVWSTFIAEMRGRLLEGKSLSDNQIAAVVRTVDKADAARATKQAERDEAKAAKSGAVDLARVEELFDTARKNGLKKLKFRTAACDLSPAPEHGRNAGSLYVTKRGEYFGKITAGKFFATREAPAGTLEALQALAADPMAVGVAYGRETGKCCACGRELTDPVSVERGIGPICESNWGL